MKFKNSTAQVSYKGLIQKGSSYRVTAEGLDWYFLTTRQYIPKFVLGPLYEDDITTKDTEEYLDTYEDVINGTTAKERSKGKYTKNTRKESGNSGKKRFGGSREGGPFSTDARRTIDSGGR